MRAMIQMVGIRDWEGTPHYVEFYEGLNVVTGKSSTGKSALIEIVDYCMGSSDFTIPEGVITNHAALYFLIFRINDVSLVLARKRETQKCFLREVEDGQKILGENSGSFFAEAYWIPIADFKTTLGRYFGLAVTDVDESIVARELRGRKLPKPSVRSFTSFMLQHQNLIANKHALFYRFDEKEKREQAIDHLKVFLGFVDQSYFLLSQKLEILSAELKALEFRLPKAEDVKKASVEKLNSLIDDYEAISGKQLQLASAEEMVLAPAVWLEKLWHVDVEFQADSDELTSRRSALERERATLTASLRREQNKLSAIQSSIDYGQRYASSVREVAVPEQIQMTEETCPFCSNPNNGIEQEANALSDAIHWLNGELRRSRYVIESFERDSEAVIEGIKKKKKEVQGVTIKIANLDSLVDQLDQHRTQYELAVRAKLAIELELETIGKVDTSELLERKKEIELQIIEIRKRLSSDYGLDRKLRSAERDIHIQLNRIGSQFEFEDSYRPINLHFSLDTFDLWHEKDGRKVFLRSMGSGANWLYCHVTLFLALHSYFASLGEQCSIPSVLMFDQPSQVYFPSSLDNDYEFLPASLIEREGSVRKRGVDEDVAAVANLYSKLRQFCLETKATTGIQPQIIVTDHADNLTLEGGVDFEDLVQARRWRKRGFVHPVLEAKVSST